MHLVKKSSRSLVLSGEVKNRSEFLHGKNCKVQVFLIGKNERFLRSQSQMQKLIRTNLSTFTDVCLNQSADLKRCEIRYQIKFQSQKKIKQKLILVKLIYMKISWSPILSQIQYENELDTWDSGSHWKKLTKQTCVK